MNCPKCGNEIEIAELLDFTQMTLDDIALYNPYSDPRNYVEVVRITVKCGTCHKGLWLNFHKPSFKGDNCVDTMKELAKDLFAEKMKESEEHDAVD